MMSTTVRRSTVDIPTADGTADAYLVGPDDGGAHPGVLFAIDAIGLRPRIEEMADRIAGHGYVVLAPNVFYRAGRAPVPAPADLTDPDAREAFMREARPLMDALTPEVVARDGSAYLERLAAEADGPVAITGYCMGVRVAWRIAVAHPGRVAALAGFHGGGLVTEDADSPHRSAGSLPGVELVLGHADEDPSMSAEAIAALEGALDEAGARYRSEVYPGASHGYTMADTAAYDEAACERHFTELLALLDRTLKPPAGRSHP